MPGFTDAVEQDILDGIFAANAWAGYDDLWVGLSSTTPTEAGGNVTEPSSGAYARVQTDETDWAAATGTAPAAKANSATVTFPTATGDWVAGADLTHFTLHDAATDGNVVAFGALGTAKPVLEDDTASFGAGDLVLQLGDPGDFA
jgi:hypothetical protein